MNAVIIISIIINLLTILLFSMLSVLNLKVPKQKAILTTSAGISLSLYLISLFVIFVLGILNKNFLMTSVIAFVPMPFIIGKKVNFNTLQKYMAVQIGVFVFSITVLIIILLK